MLLDDNNIKDLKAMMEANVIGLCICTKEAIKSMKTREVDGHIININRYLKKKTNKYCIVYMNICFKIDYYY